MRVFLVLLLVAATGAGGWYVGTQMPKQAELPENPPLISNPKTVRGLGKLEPVSGLINIVAPPGDQVAWLLNKQVGETVAKGELLITLNSRTLRAKDLALAEARRADASRKAAFEKTQAQFRLDAARLSLDEANAVDDKTAIHNKNIEVLQLQSSVANKTAERLRKILSDPKTKSLVSQAELDKQQLVADQLKLQIEQAQLEIVSAQASANRAKQLATKNVEAVEYALKNADQALPKKSLDAAIDLARQAFDQTQIKSPVDNATILDIIVLQGDSVTNRPIMILGDLSAMQCVVEVNDSLLHRIDIENNKTLRAKISSPALTAPIMGTIIRKGRMLGPPSLTDPNPFARVDRRTGTITIRLDDSIEAAKFVNLQVDVEIETESGALN